MRWVLLALVSFSAYAGGQIGMDTLIIATVLIVGFGSLTEGKGEPR